MSTTIATGLPLDPSVWQQPAGRQPFSSSGTDSVTAFQDAMRNAGIRDATPPVNALQGVHGVQGVQVVQLVPPAGVVTDVPLVSVPVQGVSDGSQLDSARDRAVEGLGLPGEPESEVGAGQSILDGLERLRGLFDGQIGDVNSRIENARFDAGDLMRVQAEVVTFSVMVDVSSKLAGKSTQAMDTLMKGQ